MDTTTKIKTLLVKYNMTATQLANELGISQSTLSKKMKKGDYYESELKKIAMVFHLKYEGFFIFKDGGQL